MIVQCPACSSRYRIREANIPPSGGKIRCPQCGHSFVVYPESSQDDHEQDEDRTSITSQNALRQLVGGMAKSNKNVATEERTEQIDKDEINRIRALQALASAAGDLDDGTVEMQNPMKIWEQAQEAVRRQDSLDNEESSSEDEEYDAAPTEVVGAAGLAKLPFPSKIPAKVPAHDPAPPYGERIEMPSKPIPPPKSPGPPALPKPPALPGSASSGQFPTQGSGGSGQFPTPGSGGSGQYPTPGSGGSGQYPTPGSGGSGQYPTPGSGGSGQYPTPGSGGSGQYPTPGSGGSGQYPTPGSGGSGQYPTPGSGGSGQYPAPGSGNYNQPGSGPTFPTSDPGPYGQPMSPPRGYAAEPWDGGAADASRDILAAIDEVTGAEDLSLSPEPDLMHGGPWKLRTNFGLTYEFPDNKSLRSWLSSRDELDGYTLSADGENFFVVHVFTQLKSRPSAVGQIPSTGMSHLGLQQPGGLGALPGSAASGQFPTGGGSGQYPSMGSGQYPAMGGSGGFTPPGHISQTMQQPSIGHGLPQGDPIQNTYPLPSRDAGGSKLLWVVFVFLIAICVALAAHTFDYINIMKLLGMEKEEYMAPIGVVVEPVGSIDSVIDSDPEAEIENLLREARRDVRNKKLQSAIERLRTIETLDPNRIEVFELRAQAFESLGKPDEAEAARERAEELRNAQPPDSPEGRVGEEDEAPDAPTP